MDEGLNRGGPREVGRARGAHNRALAEDNRMLVFPRSSRTYAKMLREDAKVKSVYRAVTLPIRRANWRLKPNGADGEIVNHVAGDLRLPIEGADPNSPIAPTFGRVSWDKHLADALHALAFGHMFFEQVYEPGVDGREHLRKLAPRWPGTIQDIKVANDGGLESIKQRAYESNSLHDCEIPVSRLVAYVFDDVGSQWVGSSIFRPAYKHWKIKDELLRKEVQTLDRNGMGVPIYEGSDLSPDPDDELERGQDIVENLRSGAYAGASIPAGSKLSLMGVSGQLVSPREAIMYHDSQIANVVLANFLNLEGGGGSYALAETQSNFFNQSEQTVADWVADTANQHVIEDLVRVAFPDYDGPCPRLSFDAIGSRKEITPGDLAQLKNAGLVLADKPLEEHLRSLYALPAKEKLSDALRSRKAREELEKQMGVSLSPTEPEQGTESSPEQRVEALMNALRGNFNA